MRWKAAPMLVDGAVRVRAWFAIVPVRVREEWVWLERVSVVERYNAGHRGPDDLPFWQVVEYRIGSR